MRITRKSAAFLFALAAVPAAADGALAQTGNWARDFVQQREAAAFERATGFRPPATPGRTPGMIVGGDIAPAGRWPFQVGLLIASEPINFYAQYCGGTIIDQEFILTAGHCADFLSANQIHVLTGTQSLARGGMRRAVKAMRIHPKFDGATLDFDVAILQLKNKMTNLSPAQTATVLSQVDEKRLSLPGTKSFVTGWGDTGSGYPNALHEVKIPLVSRAVCNESYDDQVTARMICAGLPEGGKDSCQGDSGGPLLVKNDAGRFAMQAGIVSWGEGCALPDFYGVYSRLAVLEPWIKAAMAAMRQSPSQPSASACARATPGSLACRRAAKEEAEHDMAAYLDVIERRGRPQQAQGAAAAQAAWSRSLHGLCAFEAATGGQSARAECVAKETRKRADALAGQLSDLGN